MTARLATAGPFHLALLLVLIRAVACHMGPSYKFSFSQSENIVLKTLFFGTLNDGSSLLRLCFLRDTWTILPAIHHVLLRNVFFGYFHI